jgi:acetyl-CoA acetyltransferase
MKGAALGGHVIAACMERAGPKFDPAMVDDVFMGCGMPEVNICLYIYT